MNSQVPTTTMKNRSIVVIIGEKEENGFAGSVS
jgi:hypothetical protein